MPLSWHLKKNKVGWEKSVNMIILLEEGKEVKIKPIDFRLKLVFIGDLIMAISDVQDSGSWYYILDSNGKKSATLSKSSVGTFLGIGIDFIVTQNGSWYYTYDEKGKKIAAISVSSAGTFKNAAGTSINFVNGGWIYTYDKNGKKTGTRPNR